MLYILLGLALVSDSVCVCVCVCVCCSLLSLLLLFLLCDGESHRCFVCSLLLLLLFLAPKTMLGSGSIGLAVTHTTVRELLLYLKYYFEILGGVGFFLPQFGSVQRVDISSFCFRKASVPIRKGPSFAAETGGAEYIDLILN